MLQVATLLAGLCLTLAAFAIDLRHLRVLSSLLQAKGQPLQPLQPLTYGLV